MNQQNKTIAVALVRKRATAPPTPAVSFIIRYKIKFCCFCSKLLIMGKQIQITHRTRNVINSPLSLFVLVSEVDTN